MAITLSTNQPAGAGFLVNGNSGDLSGVEVLVAAVTGKSHHLRMLSVSCAAAINITVGEGDNAGALVTSRIGPLYFAATGATTVQLVFNPPLKFTAGQAITVDASGAGNATLIAQGETK
jgi:hypothetical protein